MDVVQTLVAPVVVALFLLAAGYVFNGRLTRIETKTDRSAEQLAALTSRVDGMADRLLHVESEVAGIRSDLTHIALAVGARARPQTG